MRYLSLLFISFFLSVFAYSQKLKTYEDSVKYDRKKVEFEKMFVQANLEKNRRNYDQALSMYYDCNKILGENNAVYYEIAQIYLSQGKFSDAEIAINKAIKLSKGSNREYKRFLDDLYIKMGKKR
ncbi:MAG: tetratricopeptide repeat protein [Bacteroidales bacterium]|nr:tetratricopeptide repeat protein [Bacteroidales bacterium]